VRPQVGFTGVAGLETLVGPRYLAVLPANPNLGGASALQFQFIGLADPPVVENIDPGDLEILVQGPRQGSLRRGGPVMYRQVRVGTILSVGLASDSSTVEARLHIEKAYAPLIRQSTRFWDMGGVKIDAGLTSFTVEVGSLPTLISGGIELATPPAAHDGERIHTGHRFALESKPDHEWLQWQPTIAIGNDLLPPGAPLPAPLRARAEWRQDKLLVFTSSRSRMGWVLQTPHGLLGPADLLIPPADADDASASLEVEGTTIALARHADWGDRGLAMIGSKVSRAAWPDSRRRIADLNQPEECLAVVDSASPALALSAARLFPEAGAWRIDSAVPVDESWHGACVLARRDGLLLGMILVDARNDIARVALLPAP
jgi:hypothetical protein